MKLLPCWICLSDMIRISFVLVLLIIFLYGSYGKNCGDKQIPENKLLTACTSQKTFLDEAFIEFSNVTSHCSCTVLPHTQTDISMLVYSSSGYTKDTGCHKALTVTHYSTVIVDTTVNFDCVRSGNTWKQVRTNDLLTMALMSSTTDWETYCFQIQLPSGSSVNFTISCGGVDTTTSTEVQKSTEQSTDKERTGQSELMASSTSSGAVTSQSISEITSQSISETKDKYTQTSQDAASSDIPWEVVGGAAGGGVVAIIIIVIVIVCFCTRTKSERSKGSSKPYENNEVCEGENSSYSSVNDGYLKDNPLYNSKSNTNDGTYSTNDEKPEYSRPREVHNDTHNGTYSTADHKPVYAKPDKKGTNQNVTNEGTYSGVDEKPVYAKPNKREATKSEPGIPLYALPNKRNTQEDQSNSVPPVYAEVNKANKKQSKTLEPVRTVNQDGLVYMEVESNKNNGRPASNSQQTSNNEGTVYAEMKPI